MHIQVQLKQAGKRKNQIANIRMELEAAPHTTKELLIYCVRSCVKTFRKKQGKAPEILSKVQMEDQASAGRIAFGFFYGETKVSEEKAIETALQSYEDGLVAVFVDGEQKERMTDEIRLTESSVITFVKLTMLAGRMW